MEIFRWNTRMTKKYRPRYNFWLDFRRNRIEVRSRNKDKLQRDEGMKEERKTYSESKSLSLYIQKLLETMPSSSLVPSRPTKTKKEPMPWCTILNNDWISIQQKTYRIFRGQKTLQEMHDTHIKLKSKTSATHRLLPGFSCILWGRNFWKVLKIPAFEITAGARTSISSCPLRTTTPERYTVLSWYYYLVEISFLDIGSHLLLFLR